MKNTTATVVRNRTKARGDFRKNLKITGLIWAGLLEAHYGLQLERPIPPHIVGLMLTAMKLQRASTPFRHDPDNYVDAEAYLEFARVCDPFRTTSTAKKPKCHGRKQGQPTNHPKP
jgi:hypothetical protein